MQIVAKGKLFRKVYVVYWIFIVCIRQQKFKGMESARMKWGGDV